MNGSLKMVKDILLREEYSREEIISLLSITDEESINQLFAKADEVRRNYCGDEVQIRGIIEFSNYCEQNCLYCGLRIANKEIARYRMSKEIIMETVSTIFNAGVRTIVLQSGEDHSITAPQITDMINSIKRNYDVAITLSIGERELDEYDCWKKAGADRYLLKHETANEKLYSYFHNKQRLSERIFHLKYLKSIGFQIGSGNIIGLPGQTIQDIADDIFLCKELDVDMASFSPLIINNSTPMYKHENANLLLTLKTMAVARIVLKNVHIPATTALGTLDANGRTKGLQCGANVIMPNFTPDFFREHYQIYPMQKYVQSLADVTCLKTMLESIGRTFGGGKGNSMKTQSLI